MRLPDWARRTIGLGPTQVPWHDVIRSGIAIPVPLAVGLATGQLTGALFASLGAILAVLGERSGTSGQRLTRIAAGATCGVISMMLGRYTHGTGLEPLAVVLAFAVVSGVLSSIHPTLSWAAMQLLVQMAIAGGLKTQIALGPLVAWYLGGVLWGVAGVWLMSALERTDQIYRRSTAGVVVSLAGALRARSDYGDDGVARSVTIDAAIDATADLVLRARAVRPARRAEIARERRILDRLPLLAATVDAYAHNGGDVAVRAVMASQLDALAAAIVEQSDSTPSVTGGGGVDHSALHDLREALGGQIDDLWRVLDRRAPLQPVAPFPVLDERHHLRQVFRSADTWEYTARVVVCMGIAEVFRQLDPLGHSYWILLTTALVLKPDFQSVFARTLQRGFGTIVGSVLAAPLLLIPAGYARLIPMGLLSAMIPYAVRRNYWLFSVLITPIVVLLLDTVSPGGAGVLPQRVLNTAIGCGIVLTAGYLLWPGTWRPSIGRTLASSAEQLTNLRALTETPQPTGADVAAALQVRHSAYHLLNEVHFAFRAAAFEPRPFRRRVLAYTETAHELRVSADALTRRLVMRSVSVDVERLRG